MLSMKPMRGLLLGVAEMPGEDGVIATATAVRAIAAMIKTTRWKGPIKAFDDQREVAPAPMRQDHPRDNQHTGQATREHCDARCHRN